MKDMLEDVRVGCVATVDNDGAPRATPVHFAIWNNQVIWLSPAQTHHSQNIARDGTVSFVAWESPLRSIAVTTTAHAVEGADAEVLIEKYRAKLGASPKLDGATVYVAEIS